MVYALKKVAVKLVEHFVELADDGLQPTPSFSSTVSRTFILPLRHITHDKEDCVKHTTSLIWEHNNSHFREQSHIIKFSCLCVTYL